MTRGVALALTVLTGFSGLVYEVAWQKYLATLLGSQSEAVAAILAIFLGGLSIGYAVFGAVTRRIVEHAEREGRAPRLLLVYGAVESGIGVYAFLFPWLFRAAQALSVAIPHPAGGLGFAIDVAISAVLLLPPTILMGGTIPILTQSLARGLEDATRFHAFVYAFNTVGAFFGALCAGFFLVPWLGLERVMFAMGAVNLFAGASFVALGSRVAGAAALRAPAASAAAPRGIGAYAAVALLSGFAMMSLQTVLNRLGGLSFGSSEFTFSMVVATFVLCIALGSLVVSALPRIRPAYLVASQWILVGLLIALYHVLPDGPYWAHVVRSVFRDTDAAFYPYWLSVFVGILAVLAVPIGISGAMLPLLFHHLRGEVEDLGGVAGRLYSWNTVGSLLGALLGGYALLMVLDLHHVFRIAIAALAVGATILSVRLLRVSAAAVTLGVLLPALAGIALLAPWDPHHLASGFFRRREPQWNSYLGPAQAFAMSKRTFSIPFYDDDPTTSVAVAERTEPGRGLSRSILNNGKSDSSIPIDQQTMGLVATLPALFADRVERALVIGFGTGVTVGELAALPETREVEVAEISSAVLAAAPYFDFGSLGASTNPKVKRLRGDAYRLLLRSDEPFDVIASEPSNPWVTGVEMLYSREFLEAARDRLRPGGVYAQWIHLYETDTSVVELVLRTYDAVFDEVAVWSSLGNDLLLLGFKAPSHALDLERLEARAARPEFAAALQRALVPTFPRLLAHEMLPLGVLRAAGLHGDLQTLLHPVLSHRAARAFFRGGTAEMPFTATGEASRLGASRSLVRRYAATFGGRLPEAVRAEVVGEVCRARPIECATLLAEWAHDDPGSPALAAAIAAADALEPVHRETSPAQLALLGELFGGAQGPIDFERAEQATEAFRRSWVYAAPFSRSALLGVWNRCRDDAGRCRVGRERAERFLAGGGALLPAPGAPRAAANGRPGEGG